MAEGVFVSLRVPPDMLTRIDAAATAIGKDRSTFIRDAIAKELGETPLPPRPRIAGKGRLKPQSVRNTDGSLAPCTHPQGSRKRTSVMTVCTDCGSRL